MMYKRLVLRRGCLWTSRHLMTFAMSGALAWQQITPKHIRRIANGSLIHVFGPSREVRNENLRVRCEVVLVVILLLCVYLPTLLRLPLHWKGDLFFCIIPGKFSNWPSMQSLQQDGDQQSIMEDNSVEHLWNQLLRCIEYVLFCWDRVQVFSDWAMAIICCYYSLITRILKSNNLLLSFTLLSPNLYSVYMLIFPIVKFGPPVLLDLFIYLYMRATFCSSNLM